MRRKTVIIIVASLVVAGGVTTLLVVNSRSQTPEALLGQLAKGQGNREDLVMRLNVARGDVVAALLHAFNQPGPSNFRADVLELLMKRHWRSNDPRIEEVMAQAVKDSDVLVRRTAVKGIAVYGDDKAQALLGGCYDDSDVEIRKQACAVFGVYAPSDEPQRGPWRLLSPQQVQHMVDVCLQVQKDGPAELREFARTTIGREIEIRCFKATQVLQGSDVQGATKIVEDALKLDPENHLARIQLVRMLLAAGQKEQALEKGRQLGALIEIPELPSDPEIDGDPSDEAWTAAWKSDQFYRSSSRWCSHKAEGKSTAYLGHRGGKVFVAILGYENDLKKLIASHVTGDKELYKDDCVEIAFNPEITSTSTFKAVLNPTGGSLVRPLPAFKNAKFQSRCRVFYDRGYWACEFAIDGREISTSPITSGTIWSMDVFRARIGLAAEHCALWPPHGNAMRVENWPLVLFK